EAAVVVGLLAAREMAARELHLLGEQGGAVELDDLQSTVRGVQQIRRAQPRDGAAVAVGVVFEVAARGLERRRELTGHQLQRMRPDIAHLPDRHAALPPHPEWRRLSASATGRSPSIGAPAAPADSAARPACSSALSSEASLSTPVVPVLPGSVKPAT